LGAIRDIQCLLQIRTFGDGQADRDPAIPAESRERIFEKFYRVPRLADADVPSTGLGLVLVREVAELHGGRVTVESEPGLGSTITLRLPFTVDEE